MDDEMSKIMKTVCTALGTAFLLVPVIDEISKTMIPQMQKLASGEVLQELKALPIGQGDERGEEEKSSKPSRHEECERPEQRSHPQHEQLSREKQEEKEEDFDPYC